MKVNVHLEIAGKRVYVNGNTFAIRDKLKQLGCHWDSFERKWWIGLARKGELEKLVTGLDGQEIKETVDNCGVEGKVRYKNKTFYIIGSSMRREITALPARGHALHGLRLHLATLDGKVHFWTDGEDCEPIKMYRSPRQNRKRKTLAEMREFMEEIKNESPEEREKRQLRKWAYENFEGICRCARPLDEGDGSCMYCGYGIV